MNITGKIIKVVSTSAPNKLYSLHKEKNESNTTEGFGIKL
jgi:hypothetical protein